MGLLSFLDFTVFSGTSVAISLATSSTSSMYFVVCGTGLCVSLRAPTCGERGTFMSPFFTLQAGSSLGYVSLRFSLSFVHSLLSGPLFRLGVLVAVFVGRLC